MQQNQHKKITLIALLIVLIGLFVITLITTVQAQSDEELQIIEDEEDFADNAKTNNDVNYINVNDVNTNDNDVNTNDNDVIQVPLFVGKQNDVNVQMPKIIERAYINVNDRRADVLTKAVINCYPTVTSWSADIRLQAKATKNFKDYQGDYTYISQNEQNGVGLVIDIPLYNGAELDRARDREYRRRAKASEAVAKFFQALADIKIARRERQLMSALEERSKKRVALGVTPTSEQVLYLEKGIKSLNKITAAQAQILDSRLKLLSFCSYEYLGMVESLINEAQYRR